VVIPTYNRLPILTKCLLALENQFIGPDAGISTYEVYACTGARPIIRNPENKKLLMHLGSFTLTATIITGGK
jgi:hypothetical protein